MFDLSAAGIPCDAGKSGAEYPCPAGDVPRETGEVAGVDHPFSGGVYSAVVDGLLYLRERYRRCLIADSYWILF